MIQGLAPRGLVGLLALVLALSCVDSTSPVLEATQANLTEFPDSDAAHCAAVDCRSLTADEEAAISGEVYNALHAALQIGDVDCWEVLNRSYEKLSSHQVYVMRMNPPGVNGTVNGVANTQVDPFEVYIHEIRMETPTGRFNTLNHESEHTLRGPRPSSMDVGLWESDIQDVANNCDPYYNG